MTLVLTMHGRYTVWVLADRRLSYGSSRPPIDDAVKVMDLHATNGMGLLAYAGPGATSRGTQPSQWMKNVLRGRSGLSFENSLAVLADAATRELPPHLRRMEGGAHFIVVPAFVDGVARLYSIDNYLEAGTGILHSRFTHHLRGDLPSMPAAHASVAGTGGLYLIKTEAEWMRPMLRLVKANESGRVSDQQVAKAFAALNQKAHLAVTDGTVGPRCLVVWRRRAATRLNLAGGHALFTGGLPDAADSPTIPALSNGMDLGQLTSTIFTQMLEDMRARSPGDPMVDPDEDELHRRLARLDWGPDGRLR